MSRTVHDGAVLVIAHVSDTHFGNHHQDPASRNAALMDHLLAMDPQPDALIVTGDVADHGEPEEYAQARAWLERWPGPSAICPGNHDVRATFVEGLDRPTTSVLDLGALRVVLLDSLVDAIDGERQDHGFLPAEQLAWLADTLDADDRPALVGLHHPPTTIGIGLMDPIRLQNADELAAVLDRHPHVVAVLVGHAHTMATTTFAGRPLLIGGAGVSVVSLDAEDLPKLWYEAPPSLALHLVDVDDVQGDGSPRVVTHWRALPA